MAIVTYQKWKTIVDQEGPDSYMDGRIVMKLWCANSKLLDETSMSSGFFSLIQYDVCLPEDKCLC